MADELDPRSTAGTAELDPVAAPMPAGADDKRHKRVWLFFSGGGLRAALGSLGVVWFLNHESSGRLWPDVTRVSSVSGGSVENAALMTDPDVDTHVRTAFGRFTGQGRFRYYLPLFGWIAMWAAVGFGVWWAASNGNSTVDLLLLAAGIVVVPAMIQNLVTSYTRARLTGIALGSKPEGAGQRLHLFSAADTRSGLPVYYVSRRDEDGTQRVVLAHDRRADRNGVEYYDLDKKTSIAEMAFVSSRWPLFHTPASVDGTRSSRRTSSSDPFTIVQSDVINGDEDAGEFNLLDGGLTGTLGTRLDPHLFGVDSPSMMPTIHWDDDDGSDDPLLDDAGQPILDDNGKPESSVHRVVVDGAKYITYNPLYKIHRAPGLGGLVGVMRSITVSLNSQITLDRDLVDEQPSVWYVPVTGHGRRQPLHYKDGVRLAVFGRGKERGNFRRALDRLDIMQRAVNHEAVLLDDPTEVAMRAGVHANDAELQADLDEAGKTVELVERLRFVADTTSYFVRLPQRGLACSASGVANGFIEAEGMHRNHDRLVGIIDEFTVAVRRRGALDRLLYGPNETPASPYRWPEILDVHPSEGKSYWVSHRGDRTHRDDGKKARGNTKAAFQKAFDAQYRVFECDVQAVKREKGGPDVLVGLHTMFGWHFHGLRPRAVWAMTIAKLRGMLDDDQPVDTIAELLEAFPDVSWNLEAKRRRSMRVLLRTLDELETAGKLPNRPVIISGGMRKRTLRIAREQTARPLMTAATFVEKLRLFFGRPTPHVAVVQLPAKPLWLTSRVARNAYAQRIHVQWFGVTSKRQADELRSITERCGLSTDDHELNQLTMV